MDFPEYMNYALPNAAALAAAGGLGAYRAASAIKSKMYRRPVTRKLVKQVARNRGELKAIFYESNATSVGSGAIEYLDMTAIPQGDDDNDRTGRKVRIAGFKIRIHTADRLCSAHVILGKDETVPVYADFMTPQDGFLDRNSRYQKTEIAYIRENRALTNHWQLSKKFKAGLPVFYQGTASTDGIKNRLYLVFRNTTAGAIEVKYSVVVYFYDH